MTIVNPLDNYILYEIAYRHVDSGIADPTTEWHGQSLYPSDGTTKEVFILPNDRPTRGANPGLFEMRTRVLCPGQFSPWSGVSTGNVSDTPLFRQRNSLDPLGDDYVCEFDEGQTLAGIDGLECRFYGHDPDFVVSWTSTGLTIEIEGEDDGDWFIIEPDEPVSAGDPMPAAWNNVADEDLDVRLGHIWLLKFRLVPDFENPAIPNAEYTVPLSLTDAYGIRTPIRRQLVRVP